MGIKKIILRYIPADCSCGAHGECLIGNECTCHVGFFDDGGVCRGKIYIISTIFLLAEFSQQTLVTLGHL